VIKLRNRNAGQSLAPPFEGHGPDEPSARHSPQDASGVSRQPSARSAGCCRPLPATPAGTYRTHLRTGLQAPHRPRRGGRGLVRPAQVSYAELLRVFWRIRNPATRNRQGFDFGSQYRSAIFCHDAGQQEAAIASRDTAQQSLRRQIVTQITPASAFYRAGEYHQRYLEKHGHPGCAATIQQIGPQAGPAAAAISHMPALPQPRPPAPGKDRSKTIRTRQVNSMAASTSAAQTHRVGFTRYAVTDVEGRARA
jgi:Peptide methionine sulfoxide reductase